MKFVTTETVPGFSIVESLGMVMRHPIRPRHLGKYIRAVLRSMVVCEIPEYTGMMAQAREQAIQRMLDRAKELNADAIVGVRFQTSMVLQGSAELLAYGTAVKLS